MTQSKPAIEQNKWTTRDSSVLYQLDRWGKDYFSINDQGNITISPKGQKEKSLDLTLLVNELKSRNLKPPLLLRFDDILEDRLKKLHHAFDDAIKTYEYENKYQGVFPVKCNLQHHVIEELISSGRKCHFGLEAGSKAELLIALS